MSDKTSILVTITSPSGGGKSHLVNHIRECGFPCIVSTTTRAPRPGEVEGVDYYFISEEESDRLYESGSFAEYVIFNGAKYGVTKDEYRQKLTNTTPNIAFLILEPKGITEHVDFATGELGARHIAVFLTCSLDVRIKRLINRLISELNNNARVATHASRILHAVTEELDWQSMYNWDIVLLGTDDPDTNLDFILRKAQNEH